MSDNKKRSNWIPPRDSWTFFHIASDVNFRMEHPIGYGFLVVLGLVVLFLPAILFGVLAGAVGGKDPNSGWMFLGVAGGFVFGIGLFNFVAIIIKQYLGHLVSLLSFLIGGGMMLLGWFLG